MHEQLQLARKFFATDVAGVKTVRTPLITGYGMNGQKYRIFHFSIFTALVGDRVAAGVENSAKINEAEMNKQVNEINI